jgi:hypothetical protein
MKKLTFLMLCLLISTFCTAQTLINGTTPKSETVDMDTMKIMYAHVLLTENGKNYLGIVDAGDGVQWAIINKESKKLKGFKSPAQLFNFMYDAQWEYVDTITNVSSTGAFGQIMFGVNVTDTKLVYVFKRRKN